MVVTPKAHLGTSDACTAEIELLVSSFMFRILTTCVRGHFFTCCDSDTDTSMMHCKKTTFETNTSISPCAILDNNRGTSHKQSVENADKPQFNRT